MNTIDLTLTASEEAKICLDCEKQKCCPYNCDRYAREIKKLKRNKDRADGRSWKRKPKNI